jgi:uncharacterized protein (DUF362 family)
LPTERQSAANDPARHVVAVAAEHDDLRAAVSASISAVPTLLPSDLPRLVVIKPNLCDITSWETGVTTDPQWVGVLADQLRSIRPDVQIRIVESDAISAYKTYRSCDETFERLGFVDAAERANVGLMNLSRSDTIELSLPGVPLPVRVPQIFLEELFFISIANLKVHPYTIMTGILKNSLGLLADADIASFHPHLSSLISALHRLCPSDLCIIDGRIGLEGQGPILGVPVRMNTILFGNDALATDEVACRLMGIQAERVPHLQRVATDMDRAFGQFRLSGEIHPRPFAIQSPDAQRAIALKFGARRFYQRTELLTNRWIDRAMRFRRHPISFAKSAVAKLTGQLNAR